MNKRLYCFLLFTLLISLIISGCYFRPDSKDNAIKVSAPNAPNSIPLLYMLENNVFDVDFEVEIHKSSQQAVTKIVKEELDMTLMGVQEAAKLYNNDIPIRLANVSTWATFELMTTRADITSWTEMYGEQIWLGDKGGPIDLLTQIIMKENKINTGKDLDIKRLSANELAQLVITKTKDLEFFVLREPFTSQVKANNPTVKTVYQLGEEYQTLFNKKMPQGGIIITENFAKTNPNLLDSFQEEYQNAIQWTLNHPDEAGKLGEKYLSGLSAPIIADALENMDMEIVKTEDAQSLLEFYYEQVLDLNPSLLGGKLPDPEFYKE